MISHEGHVFEEVNGLYTGDAILPIESRRPIMIWTGEKIDYDLYCSWVAFARWGKTKNIEIQLRPVYNEKSGKWDTIVYPQKCSSTSTSTLPDHPMSKVAEVPLSHGFAFAGSFHSHPGSAFQSGTDHHDEHNSEPGLHITVGNLDKDEIDIHSRLVYRKYEYSIGLSMFISVPITCTGVPSELSELITKYYLCHPKVVPFPEEWKDRIQEPEKEIKKDSLTWRPSGVNNPWRPAQQQKRNTDSPYYLDLGNRLNALLEEFHADDSDVLHVLGLRTEEEIIEEFDEMVDSGIEERLAEMGIVPQDDEINEAGFSQE